MTRSLLSRMLAGALLLAPGFGRSAPAPSPVPPAAYQHTLSNFDGPIPFAGPGLAYDGRGHELFVFGDGTVRIFNDSGMETYAFGQSADLGTPRAVAPLENGDLLVLSWVGDNKLAVIRCNYRGEPIAPFEVRDAPAEWDGFVPSGIWTAAGKVYLVSLNGSRVVITDEAGHFEWGRDLRPLLGIEDETEYAGLSGFGVDPSGNMLFTVQTKFRAYVLSPSGELRSFGAKGSAPGKFNVVSGITGDERGNVFVTDLLRCVVMVFGPDLKFQFEFGYRGQSPGRLIAPNDVVAGNGKVFVAQNAARGVSVFRLRGN